MFSLWLIEPELWSHVDQDNAGLEGWIILTSETPGETRIARYRRMFPAMYPGTITMANKGIERLFKSDLEASDYVIARMSQGSAFHEKAWRAVIKAQLQGCRG